MKLNGICYDCEHFACKNCKQTEADIFRDDTQQVADCKEYRKAGADNASN